MKLYTLSCSRYARFNRGSHEQLATDRRPTTPIGTAIARYRRRGALPPHLCCLGGCCGAPRCRNRPYAPHQSRKRLPLDRLLGAGTRPGRFGRSARGQPPQPVDRGPPSSPRRQPPAMPGGLRLPGGRMDHPAAARALATLGRGGPLRDVGSPADARTGVRLEAAALRPRPGPPAREKNGASARKSRPCRRAG